MQKTMSIRKEPNSLHFKKSEGGSQKLEDIYNSISALNIQ